MKPYCHNTSVYNVCTVVHGCLQSRTMSSVENFYSEDQYMGSRNRISQGAVLNCVNKRENLLVGDPVRLCQCHPSGGHLRPDLHPLFTLKSQQTIKKGSDRKLRAAEGLGKGPLPEESCFFLTNLRKKQEIGTYKQIKNRMQIASERAGLPGSPLS